MSQEEGFITPDDVDRTDRELGQTGLAFGGFAVTIFAGLAILLLARPHLYLATLPGILVGSVLGLGLAVLAPYNPARFGEHRSELPPAVVAAHVQFVRDLMARLRRPRLVLLGHTPYLLVVVVLSIATRSTSTEFDTLHFWEATVGLGGLAGCAVICSGWASQMLLTQSAFRRERATRG